MKYSKGRGIYISDYRLLSANPGCPGGCAYIKDGDSSSEVWCMGEGPYTPDYTCSSTTENPGNEVISSHLNTDYIKMIYMKAIIHIRFSVKGVLQLSFHFVFVNLLASTNPNCKTLESFEKSSKFATYKNFENEFIDSCDN